MTPFQAYHRSQFYRLLRSVVLVLLVDETGRARSDAASPRASLYYVYGGWKLEVEFVPDQPMRDKPLKTAFRSTEKP